MNPLRLPTATLLLALATLSTSSNSSKRGLCYVPSDDHPGDDSIWTTTPGADLTWYYNYKYEPSSSFQNDENLHFVPMLWGASESDTGTPFLDSIKRQVSNGANISYVLGFNEPDGPFVTGGSNLAADLAAQTWIAQIEPLKELGIKLGAPAVTGSPDGFAWLESFFDACDGRCNPDFMPAHFYGNFEGIASHIGQIMGTYPNMTIWVTEWGFPNQPLDVTQEFYNMTIEWFDRMENITHYSYFGAFRSDVSNVGPNSAMLTEKGDLTDIGSWYLGGVATNNIPKAGDASAVARFAGWGIVVLATGCWMLF